MARKSNDFKLLTTVETTLSLFVSFQFAQHIYQFLVNLTLTYWYCDTYIAYLKHAKTLKQSMQKKMLHLYQKYFVQESDNGLLQNFKRCVKGTVYCLSSFFNKLHNL